MNNNFDILKNITNEELYAKTYITYSNLDDIKNKNFKAFSRFKFNGFIDILSSRLNMDFSDLRAEANRYFDESEPPKVIVNEQFVSDDGLSVDRKIALVIGAVVVVVALFIVFLFNQGDEQPELVPPVEQTKEEQIIVSEPTLPTTQITNEINSTELNTTQDTNKTTQTTTVLTEGIKIMPSKYIWVGVINLETKEKKEYSGSNEIVLDKTKRQIIVVDGAYLTIKSGDVETKYAQDGRVRFMVENNDIKEIRFAQFKELNDGKAW